MPRTSRHLAITLLAILAAVPASAVVVSFDATDSAGRPLPGATIQIGDDTAVTGADGSATLEVDAEPGDEISVVVIHRRQVVFDRAVIVPAEGGVTLDTIAPTTPNFDRDDPFLADGFESGDSASWSRISVTGRVGTERVEPGLSAQSFEVTTRVNGDVVPDQSQSGSLSPAEIDQARAAERKRHELPTNFGVRLEIPLGSLGGARRLQDAPGSGGYPAPDRPPDRAAALADDSAGRPTGWRFYPSLSVGVSQADVELQALAFAAGTETTFQGNGPIFGAGLRGVIFPCAECRWFMTLGYEHSRTDDIDMARSPGLQTFLPDGIIAAEDRVEYRARADELSFTVGRSQRRVAFWLGARSVSWRSELDVDLLLRADGAPAEQSQSARNEFEEDLVEALAGADIRFPGSRFVVRLEGSSDGDNYEVALGLGASLGR